LNLVNTVNQPFMAGVGGGGSVMAMMRVDGAYLFPAGA